MKDRDAMFWESGDDGRVRCSLCAHRCVIPEGEVGFCGVRQNRDGTLVSLVYGRPVSMHVDPIEKKPLYHFHPGSTALSIATVGCNFRCLHCQNASISMVEADEAKQAGEQVPPREVVDSATKHGCDTIAYTYTEPTIFLEYAFDIARLASQRGLKNMFVTNGYITEAPLRQIAPYLDAANVDLKSFRDDTYRRLCSARLKPVLRAIELYHELGIWLEVTTLIIPECNDSPEELRQIAGFIAGIDPDIPWHISRFHPSFKMRDKPITPTPILAEARDIGEQEGLNHIYIGNARVDGGQNTVCPSCSELLVERSAFGVTVQRIISGHCPDCGAEIGGHW